MPLIHCDVEATGPVPALGTMTSFGMVCHTTGDWFHGKDASAQTMQDAADWLSRRPGRSIMVSDNPAFDFMWLADTFWRHLNYNPFGHSARRISDFYAGLCNNFHKTQEWKKLRVTPHDHNPVHDAQGNREALISLISGIRP